MGVYILKEKLPSAYQEVEWIGSSRTQVINTGVIPATQTYTAELEIESTQSGGEYWAFGIWGTTGFRGGQDNSGHWDTSFGASYEPSSYSLNTKTKITMSNAGKGTSSNTAIGLFGMGENGAYANNRKGAYKIYYCKIWDSGTLIRDFVPCYRKSDDEIGMYDLVNNQFYTNSGSGTFTKGQDINYVEHELKNAYIGEYGRQPGANTVAYYKFDGNLNDDSGNSHDMSLYTGSVTYGTTSQGGKYAHFNQNTWTNYWTYSGFNYDGENTISFRFNPQTIFSSGGPHDIVELWENSTYTYLRIANSIYISYGFSPDYTTSLSANTWYNIIYTRSGNSAELFINGELVKSGTPSYSGRTNQTMRFRVNQVPDTNSSSYANNGYYSEIIWENKARTTQEKLNYYNSTKNLY